MNIKPRINDSPSWKAILKMRDIYYNGRRVTLNKGDICRIWKDPICDGVPFEEKFPELSNICQEQDCTVSDFVENGYTLLFRRNLTRDNLSNWNFMVRKIGSIATNDLPDKVYWALNKNGKFFTKSMYMFLEKTLAGANYKWIWLAKLPLEIKIFMWQLFQNAIVTRDNMRKRKWPGSPMCLFW
jgi:hypothetical protein